MKFLERVRYVREFNRHCRSIAKEHPDWERDEVYAQALDNMQVAYGASPDWQNILQLLLRFILTILPFFFLSEEENA